jgi:hypothetical protein
MRDSSSSCTGGEDSGLFSVEVVVSREDLTAHRIVIFMVNIAMNGMIPWTAKVTML